MTITTKLNEWIATVTDVKTAFECFGGQGYVASALYKAAIDDTVVELNEEFCKHLKQYLPGVTVLNEDTFKVVDKFIVEGKTFDFIDVDNNMTSTGRYEHFDLFPKILKLADKYIAITLITSMLSNEFKVYAKGNISKRAVEARKEFYNGKEELNETTVLRTYQRQAELVGKQLELVFYEIYHDCHARVLFKVSDIPMKDIVVAEAVETEDKEAVETEDVANETPIDTAFCKICEAEGIEIVTVKAVEEEE